VSIPKLAVPLAGRPSAALARNKPEAFHVHEPSARPAPAPQTSFSTDRPPLKVRDFKAWLKNHTNEYRDQLLYYSGYTTLAETNERTPVYKVIEAFQRKFPLKSIMSLVVDWKGIPSPEGWSPEPEWADASVAMADFSRGRVVVLFGREVEPDSFWYKYELPALKGNPNVTEIQQYVLNEDGRTFEGPKIYWPEK
jgi:hypothetical protein